MFSLFLAPLSITGGRYHFEVLLKLVYETNFALLLLYEMLTQQWIPQFPRLVVLHSVPASLITMASLSHGEIVQAAQGNLVRNSRQCSSCDYSFLLFIAGWTDFQRRGHYHCVWVHGWWWILLRKYWGWLGPLATSEILGFNLVAGEQKLGDKIFCCWNTCLLRISRLFLAIHVLL